MAKFSRRELRAEGFRYGGPAGGKGCLETRDGNHAGAEACEFIRQAHGEDVRTGGWRQVELVKRESGAQTCTHSLDDRVPGTPVIKGDADEAVV